MTISYRRAYAIALNESWRDGLLTLPELRVARKPLWIRPRVVRGRVVDLMEEVKSATYKGMEAEGLSLDFHSIVLWIKDHWKEILAVIMRILPLIVL